MKNRLLHIVLVCFLIMCMVCSSFVVAAADSSFTPDVYDVCASVLAASGLTFKTTAAYRLAGQRFYEYLQGLDDKSSADYVKSVLADFGKWPFKASAHLIADVRTFFHNHLSDDQLHVNVGAKFYKSFSYYNSLSKVQQFDQYAFSYIENATSLKQVSCAYTDLDSLCAQAGLRGFWMSHGTLIGQCGSVRAYGIMYTDSIYGIPVFALFDGDTCLAHSSRAFMTINRNSTISSYSKERAGFYISLVNPSIRDQYKDFGYCVSLVDSEGYHSLFVGSYHLFGSSSDYVPWTDVPTLTIDYNSIYSSPDTAQGITIDTLIYMPTYNDVSDTQLAAPITPDSVRSDSGGTDPEPKPEPKPDPGTEPEESVINKIYNFIVPILGEIKAGISDLIDAVAKIPAKIGDLLGGIGDDLAGLAAFLPTLLGILTGYTLFVSLFSHFLPEPVYLTVYAFFVATIVVHLIRWVANR